VSTRDYLVALELRRCHAIGTGNVLVLADLLTDDYVHVHGTGQVDDKAAFIKNIVDRPRIVSRGDLAIERYETVALIRGEQFNSIVTEAGPAQSPATLYTVQGLRLENTIWRYCYFQATAVHA
jgi:hypothetical protein